MIVIENSSGEWNYYNDGKRWLFKMIWKKKTVFWISIPESAFRVTFWFGDKAEPLITGSDLPEVIKNDFKTSKKYGAVRAVSIIVNKKIRCRKYIKTDFNKKPK